MSSKAAVLTSTLRNPFDEYCREFLMMNDAIRLFLGWEIELSELEARLDHILGLDGEEDCDCWYCTPRGTGSTLPQYEHPRHVTEMENPVLV